MLKRTERISFRISSVLSKVEPGAGPSQRLRPKSTGSCTGTDICSLDLYHNFDTTNSRITNKINSLGLNHDCALLPHIQLTIFYGYRYELKIKIYRIYVGKKKILRLSSLLSI